MWNEKPKNWPDDLPYCDPNNQLKGEKGKPSQKVLLRMFSFLVKLYMVIILHFLKCFNVTTICRSLVCFVSIVLEISKKIF